MILVDNFTDFAIQSSSWSSRSSLHTTKTGKNNDEN